MTDIENKEHSNEDPSKNSPEILIPEIKLQMRKMSFEKALELAEKAIKYQLEKVHNDKFHLDCAKFYILYAEILIEKLMNDDDILKIPSNSQNNIESKQDLSSAQPINSDNNIPNEIDQSENQDELNNQSEINQEEISEEASDEEVCYDNLLCAQHIFEKHIKIKNFDEFKETEIPYEGKTLYFDLAKVFLLFGELEMCKSDFKSAVEFFQKSLAIRRKYDDRYSRLIADLYFQLGMVFDFDPKKSLLCFYKTKIIMEYHMQKHLESLNSKDRIYNQDEDSILDLFTEIYPDQIKTRKDLVELKDDDDESLKEFKEIISELYMKVNLLLFRLTTFYLIWRLSIKLSRRARSRMQ